jgi:hypothetical protein
MKLLRKDILMQNGYVFIETTMQQAAITFSDLSAVPLVKVLGLILDFA